MTRIDLMFFFAQLYKKRSFTVVHIVGSRTTVKIVETDKYTLNLDSLMSLISNYLRSKVLL